MLAWLKHMWRTPPPQDADAQLQLLRLSAARIRALDPEAARHLDASAESLERAVKAIRQHGDQYTNDQLTAILSGTRLDIEEQFSDLLDLQKKILITIEGNEQKHDDRESRMEAALLEARAVFQEIGEQFSDLKQQYDDLKVGQGRITAQQNEIFVRLDNKRARIEALEQAVRMLLERAAMFSPDEAQRLASLVEKHEAEYQARLREAGGDANQ